MVGQSTPTLLINQLHQIHEALAFLKCFEHISNVINMTRHEILVSNMASRGDGKLDALSLVSVALSFRGNLN